ncbi:MAG: diguanylate cyclase [Candidatus Acidiferrales bacterium]|jgi:diguanylate cyclase (GGDEF)-like protein/PAS domain S-box-containing protein
MAVFSDGLLPALFDSADEAIFAKTLDGTVLSWNRGAEEIFGYSPGEVLGRSVSLLFPPGQRHELDEILQAVRNGLRIRQRECVRLSKDGRTLRLSVTISPIRDSKGAVVAASVVARDVTGAATGESLRDKEDQLQSVVEQMPIVLWTTDRGLRLTANWGAGSAAGLRSGAAVGQTIRQFFHCRGSEEAPIVHHQEALQGLSSRFEYEYFGRVFDFSLGPLRGAGGKIVGCIGVGLDVTERKRTEDQMRYLATHDSLTGLANHRHFITSLEAEIRRARRSERPFSLLLLDLDGLKSINDEHGHLAGDRALIRFADVLRQHCRSTDLAARYGGDEFALLLIDSGAPMVKDVTLRIGEFLGADTEKPPLAVSTGFATYPDDGLTPRALIHAADRRLYGQKSSRGPRLTAVP